MHGAIRFSDGDQQRGDIAVDDVLKHALNITPKDDPSEKTQDATRVVNVLKEMGFYRVRTRKGDKRANRYRRKKADE